ncbi:hypothetical protein METP1_01295 [Methanosarcinales archaeon]|nr:hypothetical protein METP1_01295 [Methanosarcinales archaeon]
MIKYLIIFILTLFIASLAGASTDNFLVKENIFNESNVGFSTVFVDGFGINSNGFMLILRTYERLQGTRV